MSVHVGQQPIVDADGVPFGYELLFRSASDAVVADGQDGDRRTAQVLVSTFLEFGFDQLVGDRLAFVNLPRAFLVGELPLPFAPGRVVLEVLEDVPADADVVTGIRRLADAGHLIALDDVTAEHDRAELLPLADYVKVDLLGSDLCRLPELVRRSCGDGRRIVAEKVETVEQLDLCRRLGVELFQGHLFASPQTLSHRSLPPSRLACLRLVTLLADPETPTSAVVAAVEADPALSLKLLQVAGSAAAGLSRSPRSLRDAVLLVGRGTLQGWAVLVGLGAGMRTVPVMTALRRARMCQLLADSLGADGSAAFLTGVLSGLATVMDVDLDALLGELTVTGPVRAALLTGDGVLGDVLVAALAYEGGGASCYPRVSAEQARRAYLAAGAWSQRTARVVGPQHAERSAG